MGDGARGEDFRIDDVMTLLVLAFDTMLDHYV